jgi:hypothetical protein
MELFLGLYQKWPFMHLIYVILPVYLASLITNLLDLTIRSSIESFIGFYRQLNGQFFSYFVGLGLFLCL